MPARVDGYPSRLVQYPSMFFPLKDYNPTRRFPLITLLLILANCGVFVYQNFLGEKPAEYYILSSALVPWEITHMENARLQLQHRDGSLAGAFTRRTPPYQTLLYSIFMHMGLLHIFGNMLFLWIFGNNVEDHLGKFRFILFYFLCGIGSSLIHVAFNADSLVPVLGASGAVSGVMGAYLILFPRARIRTLVLLVVLVTFVDIPAAIFLVIWFLYQFLYAAGGGGIAWLAHVGGFLLGILLCLLLKTRRKPIREIREGE